MPRTSCRTPVATLRAVLESRGAAPSAGEWPGVRAGLSAETDRVDRLVEALLLLARADLRGVTVRPRAVDLDDVLHAAADRAHLRTGTTVDTTAIVPVQLRTDPELLERVVDNLLDNGCRHAASTVRLATHPLGDGSVELVVDDDGPGIPAPQRDEVFQRFVRLDEARGRDIGGTGLGLAIVAELLDLLGAVVTVGESPAGGARFTVLMPRSTDGVEQTSDP